jgi:hypothetical protein
MLHDNFVTRPNKVTMEDILADAPRSTRRKQLAVRLATEDLIRRRARMRSNDLSERWVGRSGCPGSCLGRRGDGLVLCSGGRSFSEAAVLLSPRLHSKPISLDWMSRITMQLFSTISKRGIVCRARGLSLDIRGLVLLLLRSSFHNVLAILIVICLHSPSSIYFYSCASNK